VARHAGDTLHSLVSDHETRNPTNADLHLDNATVLNKPLALVSYRITRMLVAVEAAGI
jgi:hypothetical protein